MELLVSTNEAANILGLSVQGIHYRIKTKKLKSIKKDRKVFVYLDKNLVDKNTQTNKTQDKQNQENQTTIQNEIVKIKDEQISFLKKSLGWITKQNKKEIKRLQKSHDKVIDAFKSEISLLQKAYNELHKLYQSEQEKIAYNDKTEEIKRFLNIKEFVALLLDHGYKPSSIKNIIIQKVQDGDKRFIFNSFTKELKILNDPFKDII